MLDLSATPVEASLRHWAEAAAPAAFKAAFHATDIDTGTDILADASGTRDVDVVERRLYSTPIHLYPFVHERRRGGGDGRVRHEPQLSDPEIV